jgi:hypothetical protein
MMKVLIDESDLTRTGKETADPLIKILVSGNVIPAHTDPMLFGAARIRPPEATALGARLGIRRRTLR